MATRVDIGKGKFPEIRFPCRCLVCGEGSPDSVRTMASSWISMKPLGEAVFASWKVEAPVCRVHERNLIFGKWVARLIFVALIVVLVRLILLLNAIFHFGTAIGVIVLIVLMALMIFSQDKIYTAPFIFDSRGDLLLLTFRNDEVAEEFARLNDIETVYDIWNQERRITEPARF